MTDVTEQTDKCANLACHCPASAGSQYCSEQCELKDNDPETGACRCEHVECRQEQIL
jgi:hypothetical protein